MSADNKNASSSSGSGDPLFDGLKSSNTSKPLGPPQKIGNLVPPQPEKYKAVTGGEHTSGFKYFLKEKLTKKEFIIGSIIFVILLGGAIAFGLTHKASAPTAQQKAATQAAANQPVVYTSPLTGLPVTQAQTKNTVTAVMIENSDFARPQSGLREAGVVYEAIAEAGITRFMALYQEARPKNIGPIRSARPYYALWALGFDAPYAHVGGSPEALNDIKAWHVKDMNEFAYGGNFHRISSRVAPHNVYTSIDQLSNIERQNNWKTSHFTGWERKKPAPATTPTAATIDFKISSPDFFVHYKYDKSSNSYLRWEGGAAHVDATTGKQLHPNVVIGVVMPYAIESDNYHSSYNTLGSGTAYIFQDGKVTVGAWHKATRSSMMTFTTAGKTIALNPGQTWITALGSTGNVSYQP